MTPEEIFASDERIVTVREYAGFVPNAYRGRCPRVAIDHHRDGTTTRHTYDAKRSHGVGPSKVGYSAKGGRLYSE